MKTKEWIIKLLSYLICAGVVCAVFYAQKNDAQRKLQAYVSAQEQGNRSKLLSDLEELKGAVSSLYSGNMDAYEQVSFYCQALSYDTACIGGGTALSAYFNRIKNAAAQYREGGEDPLAGAMLSRLYIRLSVMEKLCRQGRINELTDAISETNTVSRHDITDKKSVSREKAKKTAFAMSNGLYRFEKCDAGFDGFVFSTSTCTASVNAAGDGELISRKPTQGKRKLDAAASATKAEEYIKLHTGYDAKAELISLYSDVYYFYVTSGEKRYPVGIDPVDGSTVFAVLSP